MNQILSTRLLIPKPRKGFVVRTSLFEQLDDIINKRLTVIKGTPGSGKTTLLSSYIEQNALTVRWIALDDECNYIPLFWDYVVESLSVILGKSAGEFATFLKAGAGQNINEALKILINSIDQSPEIVLVLDDFHLLHNAHLLQSFEYFLANIPPSIHIVLLTREAPAIYLAGYELQGELLYIDETELALTKEESLQFLKQTLSLSQSDENLMELVREAEGWIGGLQLLAASRRLKSASKAFRSPSNKVLLNDYITTEIFDRLTPGEQEFLVLTSVPTYFNKIIAEHLLTDVNYEDILSALLSQNLMIQCIDEDQELFRYHNLFRDHLRSRFDLLDEKMRVQAYRTLSEVFHELGDEDEALRYLFLLEDYDAAMPRILELPGDVTYYNYMGKVPVERAVRNFDFAFQKLFYHYYIYEYEVCTKLHHEAMQLYSGDERYGAFIGFPQTYGGETFSLSPNMISTQTVKEMEMQSLTRALVCTKNAAFLFYQDQYILALEAVNESIANDKRSPLTYLHYFNLSLKTQICEEMGLLSKALAVQEQIRKLIEGNKILKNLHSPTFSLTVAGLYMKQMRLEEAGQILKDCEVPIAEHGGQLQLTYDYNYIEYLFLTEAVDDAVKLLGELMETEAYENILMVSSLLKYQHRAGTMTKTIQEYFEIFFDSLSDGIRTLNSRLLYARIKAGCGERQKALSELDEVLQIARKQKSYLKIVEATLQRLSVMIGNSTDLRRLTDLYKEALHYACENKIQLPFYMEADTVATIHQQYGDQVIEELSEQEKTFHNDMVKMCITKKNCILSEREQEIIKAIADGLTNNDIAARLFISLPTVKTHISNVFRKLEVKGRVAAVDKARKMGIV